MTAKESPKINHNVKLYYLNKSKQSTYPVISCSTFIFYKVSLRINSGILYFKISNKGGGHTLGFVALNMNHSMNLLHAQFGLLIIYNVFVLYWVSFMKEKTFKCSMFLQRSYSFY